MRLRRRGRFVGLAVAAAATVVVLAGMALAREPPPSLALVVSDRSGSVLARVPLPAGGAFSLRYRNSVYGSLAEERFIGTDDRSLRLVALAADELAVLEEYYAADGPIERPAPQGAGQLRWRQELAIPVDHQRLPLAATELGERTLLVDGQPPLHLPSLVGEDPMLILALDQGRG